MIFLPFFAVLIALADAVTGASKMGLCGPIFSILSSSIKLFFLVYLFTVSEKFSKVFLKAAMVGVGLFSVKYIYLEAIPSNLEIAYIFKLLYPFLICFCLADFSSEKLLKFFKYLALSYISILFITYVFDIGSTTYDTGAFRGWKGPFFAGNELGLSLLVIFCLILPEKDLGSRIVQIFLFLALLLVGTKTTIFGGLISALVVVHFTKTNLLRWKVVVPMLAVLGFTGYQFSISFLEKFIQVQKRTGSNSILLALYEKRYLALERNFEYWMMSGFDLLGIKFNYLRNKGYQAVEMDLFDVFFNSGIFIVILLVLVYSYVGKNLTHLKSKNICYAVGFLICMAHAIFAGHVLYSGTVVLVLGLMMAVMMNQTKTNEVE